VVVTSLATDFLVLDKSEYFFLSHDSFSLKGAQHFDDLFPYRCVDTS
jgi:hypothetical protein